MGPRGRRQTARLTSDSLPSFYAWPPLGSLVDGQVYINTATASDFALDLGATDG